ncbi:MAG: hypothetical protein ACFFCC_03995 [Promethearchaeota archaeon]
MKKRSFFYILLVLFIEFISFSNTVKSFENNLYYLEINKEYYYPDEIIKINASWFLDYNPMNEEAYIQLRLTDEFDATVWNSSEYNGIGNFSKNWSVYISNLNYTLKNYTHLLYLNLLSVFHQIGIGDVVTSLLKTIPVKIIKKIPYCQLIGFREQIKYGENLSFQACFLDSFLENNTFLNNQLINFYIEHNNSIFYQSNFTTNNFGLIDIFLSSPSHLNLGVNSLIIKLDNNFVFNDTIFQFEITVEKNLVIIDVVNFKEDLNWNENLNINLSYYYFINNTKFPLNNQSVELLIINENNVTYKQIYKTDDQGLLIIDIPQSILNFNSQNKDYILKLIYNGTFFLENSTFFLNLRINIYEFERGFQFQFVLIIAISAVILLISLVVLIKFKSLKKKLLPNITIRY